MGNPLKLTLDPANPPAIGFEWDDAGFKYVVKAVRPHRNQKGEASLVVTWRCICAEDGAEFEAKSGARVYSMPRRCKEHNIGWVKAYPFGAPRPDNAPGAGLSERDTIKRFVDGLGLWLDNAERAHGDAAYDLVCDYLETLYPGILD